METKTKKKESKLIKRFKLKRLENSLYIGFMRKVNHFVELKTPLVLGITGCYQKFAELLDAANKARKPRSKNPLTEELDKLHERRKACFRCLKGHVWSDLDNDDPALREHARILRNKIESYGDLLRASRTTFTVNARYMSQDMSVEPLATDVAKLGQTANLRALIAANTAYHDMVAERRKGKMDFVPNTFRNARLALDKGYQDLVAAVNAQIIASQFVDGSDTDRLAELEDFAGIVNELISSYRTTAKQSGPDKKQ